MAYSISYEYIWYIPFQNNLNMTEKKSQKKVFINLLYEGGEHISNSLISRQCLRLESTTT